MINEVKTLIESLVHKGYVLNGMLGEDEMGEIASCKVNNAIILITGGVDIFAKSVYSVPKGLFMENGETLIEQQIRQLKESGIDDITAVIPFKSELYFFSQNKWG